MIVLIAIWGLIVAWVVNAARKRDRDPVLWGVIAVLIGIFAFIPLLLMGQSREGHLRQIKEEEHARAEALEEIEDEARVGHAHSGSKSWSCISDSRG